MGQVTVVKHPMVQDSLTHLRRQDLGIQKFRHHSDKICELLFYEAVQELSTKPRRVETVNGPAAGVRLSEEVIIVPVLRSGVALLPAALRFLPKSKVGFVGLERDEQTACAHEYYWKLPEIHADSVVIVTDPMLATGGSIVHVLRRVLAEKPGRVIVVSVISAPEGVGRIQAEFPQVDIYTGAIDEKLNDVKFIVPGLGDYGDRYFGTI